MLAVLTVGVLVGPRLLHVMPPSRGGTHATVVRLPPGVCQLSTESWSTESDSTRVEAKLVTYESFVSSDPDFSWLKEPLPASSARPSTPPPPYFWVIAEVGTYTFNIGHFPPYAGPHTFRDLWIYVRADQCTAGGAIRFPVQTRTPVDGWPLSGLHADGNGWPAWFDQMPAVTYIKIR